MYLNLLEDHFSYIKDLRSYSQSFSWSKCGKLWKFVTVIPEGYAIPTNAFFEKIEEFGIDIPEDLKYYPYRATYDIEAMLDPTYRP